MFLSDLYIHPRPATLSEPRRRTSSASTSTPRPAMPPRPTVTREQAIQEALDAEFRSWPPDFSCIVDRQGSFTVSCPEESYSTENVAEALRIKQRMNARRALRDVATSYASTSGRPPSSSSSCASSPANSPPPTPRLLPVDLPIPAVQSHDSEVPADRPSRGRYSGVDSARLHERYARIPKSSDSGPRRELGPSQSRSSLLHRSLSRHSSRNSMVSPSPPVAAPASASTSYAIIDMVRRLPPLPRYNPFRRARAESMSSVVDANRSELGGAFCGLLPRRRCKSESDVPLSRRA